MTTSVLRQRLLARPEVRYAEPDYLVAGSATFPNDPGFPDQYGLNEASDHDIDAPSAWTKRTNCSKVAVLDTGVDTNHPDLAPNLWHNTKETPDNGKDDDGNGYVDDAIGVDIIHGSGSAVDGDGHGTHVAGIVAGVGNNAIGVSGVCWTGSVMAVKFMNFRGKGSTSDASEAIRYAARMGAKVINASFGSSSKSHTLQDAVEYAQDKGVLIVVAAGNDGEDIDKHPVYPASFGNANILTVAASTRSDKLASFSNYGDEAVDVAAAGEDILSTYLGNRYATLSGTSMAAPLVAGMAGFLRAANPDASYKDVKTGLRQKVDKPSALKNKVLYDGRANLKKALDYIVTK